MSTTIERGLCQCGCGAKAAIAQQTNNGRGFRKGEPQNYARGHCPVGTKSARFKHGGCHTPMHRAWCSMRSRCDNKKNKDYHRYGGRGIRVDPRWYDFETFARDMWPRPDGCSLDRIDNNAGYGPENCKWSAPIEQNNNKSSTRIVCVFGSEIALTDACRGALADYQLVYQRLGRGWDIHNALFTPAREYARRVKPC